MLRRIHRFPSPVAALKIIGIISLYLAGLALLPSAADAWHAVDGAGRKAVTQVAQLPDPAR